MPATHKAKQYWVAIAKFAVLAGAFYIIWQKLSATSSEDWQQFRDSAKGWPWYSIATLLILSIANRVLEIFKWQNLARELRSISWTESAKQVLSALTAGIFTPNGIGEYGAKALYFEKDQAKKVVLLNLVCNGIQMFWSIVFGLFGLVYFNLETGLLPAKTVLIFFGVVLIAIATLTMVRNISIRGFSLGQLFENIWAIPKKTHRLNIALGFLRYLSFSLQYVLLFRLFGVEIPFALLFSGVAAVYLLASSLPSFQFLDFAVKGGVAVFFFGFIGMNEWAIVSISTIMWFFNVVLPVAIGGYFVVRFKSTW